MRFAKIALPFSALSELYTYSIPAHCENIQVGHRAVVPLSNRLVVAVIVELLDNPEDTFKAKIKPIECLYDPLPVITKEQIALCQFVSRYYFASLGETLRQCLPPDTPKSVKAGFQPKEKSPKIYSGQSKARSLGKVNEKSFSPQSHRILTSEQKQAVETITQHTHGAFLLEGVTGSGKTEVYLQAAKKVLAENKSVLVMAPEIALSPQLQNRFTEALEEPVLMLHSGLSHKERREGFFQLLRQEVRVVVGARSALFAPLPSLGLIVVDEEHEPSYKQEEAPRYHARDTAIWRAHEEKALIVLGSATPSLESRLNVQNKKLHPLYLSQRIAQQYPMPTVEIIDLRSRALHSTTHKKDKALTEGQALCILSGPLKEAIEANLSRKEQTLIFLNRRGYSSFALCDYCGVISQCPNCSVSLTYHQQKDYLQCHQCDYTEAAHINCYTCGQGPLIYLGLGTERVETELRQAFPEARIARLDRDTASNYQNLSRIIKDMHDTKTDILVGTQMIAKGHDFSHVSLVGVVLADTGLALPDFRAAERTFQLLVQVAGRSGRSHLQGRVIIQTFHPEHPAISFAQRHDTQGFMEAEALIRKEAHQPPFVRAALLRIEGPLADKASSCADFIEEKLKAWATLHPPSHFSILGPAKAPFEKLRNRYRFHIYLRTTTSALREKLLKELWEDKGTHKMLRQNKSRLVIDIDPIHLM